MPVVILSDRVMPSRPNFEGSSLSTFAYIIDTYHLQTDVVVRGHIVFVNGRITTEQSLSTTRGMCNGSINRTKN